VIKELRKFQGFFTFFPLPFRLMSPKRRSFLLAFGGKQKTEKAERSLHMKNNNAAER
jgi:hypothetical protein